MRASALRIAACVGMLVGCLILADGMAGVTSADPGGRRDDTGHEESSKGVNNEHGPRRHPFARILGEHRKPAKRHAFDPPNSTIGSGRRPGETAPKPAPASDREAQPDGQSVSRKPESAEMPDHFGSLRYLLEQLEEVVSPQRAAVPAPEPTPSPAFRGPTPAAPAPEPDPVLDAIGGVAGGSGNQGSDFSDAPVLHAPVIAVPAPPAASAAFPAVPSAAPGGSRSAAPAAPRPVGTGTRPDASTVRPGANPELAPTGTVAPTSGQSARQGYTEYLRSPGLPEIAGAALPGVGGIALMTLGGGVIGYRQASAGRTVRMSGAARYLP
jgi:hypothetical protein